MWKVWKKTPEGKRRRSELEKILAKNAHYKKLKEASKQCPISIDDQTESSCEEIQTEVKKTLELAEASPKIATEMEVDSSKNESAEHTEVKISLAKFALERRLLFFMSSI